MSERQQRNDELQDRNYNLLMKLYDSQKESFERRLSQLESEIFELKTENTNLNKRVDGLVKRCEESERLAKTLSDNMNIISDELDDVLNETKRPCLIVNNLPVQSEKSDEDIFIDLCTQKLGIVNMTADKISKIHRLHKPNNNLDSTKPRALVVKFAKDRYRDEVFRSKKNLKSTGIVISELLSKRRSALLKKCIDLIPGDRTSRSIWTDNGRILVKVSNEIIHVSNENDIQKILQKFFPNASAVGIN